MTYRLLSFAVLLLALHCALAMPDHPASMRMSGELSHEVDMRNDTAVNNATATGATSTEDDDDDNVDDDANEEDGDDDEIHVEGKTASCPPRQPDIMEIEQQCMAEYKEKEKGGTCMEPPTKDILVIEKEAPDAATIRLETVPDSASSEESTDSPGHKHRALSSYYYHCLLKKLDWLNECEALNKPKIEAWMTANVTDATQRQQSLEMLNHCLVKTGFIDPEAESITESTEETEQSTETSKKQEQMNCDASKQLVCCLNHAECPLLTYP